jgi:serine/threonine protein kinase
MTGSSNESYRYVVEHVISDEFTSVILQALDQQTGDRVALKIPKPGNTQTTCEAAIVPELDHPCILNLRDTIPTENGPCLIFPFAEGRDLFSVIQDGPIPECEAQRIFYNVLHALNYLHQRQICHRDVKPENILLMNPAYDPSSAVLSDFGFAAEFKTGICHDKPCGSPQYAAPELYAQVPYTSAVDIWALGMALHGALTATFPFDASDPAVMTESIMRELPLLFASEELPYISELGQDLIRAMLQRDPENRITASEALAHPWFDAVREELGLQDQMAVKCEVDVNVNDVRNTVCEW